MAEMKKYKAGRMIMGRLEHGADLLEEITEICRKEDIRMGRVEAIGAVSVARIGFYNQDTHEYQFFTIDQPLEILSLAGNVSIKDGESMVHAHVVLGDKEGKAFGGHLAAGTIVFACECIVEILEGPTLERGLDEKTGLPLWNI